MAVVSLKSRKARERGQPERLEEVLDVAGRMFHENGYRSTSLKHIGDALGMNKASLYYYVKSKQDLARRLILRASERLRDMYAQSDLNRLPADEALGLLIREHCHVNLDHPHEMGLLIQQRRFIEPAALGDIPERERLYVAHVRSLIARGIEEGQFRKVDVSVATQLTLDAINSVLRWYKPGGRLDRDAVVAEIRDYILSALRPGARAAKRKR